MACKPGALRPCLTRLRKCCLSVFRLKPVRRVRYQDVIDYKKRIDGERRKALDELAAQSQELQMGY